MIKCHQQDKAAHTKFISSLFSPTTLAPVFPVITPNEQFTINQIDQTLSTTKDEEEVLEDNPLFFKKVFFREGLVIGTCTGVVHSSPEELLAYNYLTKTHHARESHIVANGQDSSKYPNNTIRTINDHHQILYSCRKLPPPLKTREWLTRVIFQRVNEDTIKYFSTSIHDNDPDLPPSGFTKTTMTNIVRGVISIIHEYERLPQNQTRFTLRLKVDIKGR